MAHSSTIFFLKKRKIFFFLDNFLIFIKVLISLIFFPIFLNLSYNSLKWWVALLMNVMKNKQNYYKQSNLKMTSFFCEIALTAKWSHSYTCYLYNWLRCIFELLLVDRRRNILVFHHLKNQISNICSLFMLFINSSHFVSALQTYFLSNRGLEIVHIQYLNINNHLCQPWRL